ncbi:MAG: hypothetical protein M3T55_04180 [Pseudomonadota bacterium]|nr:hypothetical protein [Pseudomonadota bacterium]
MVESTKTFIVHFIPIDGDLAILAQGDPGKLRQEFVDSGARRGLFVRTADRLVDATRDPP